MTPRRFDPAASDRLGDPERFRYLSRDELVWSLDPDPTDRIADLGCGTGFYTREIAPFVEEILALDLQPRMLAQFGSAGVPNGVTRVIAKGSTLPLQDAHLDGAVSTMTYHEFDDGAVGELARVIRPGGRLVIADWSAGGSGERGPPVEDRRHPEEAAKSVDGAGFDVHRVAARPETFLLVAERP
ncbi:MAG: methyltransferase domain-containing protein [Halodesulfurarchaeum sp.]